MSRLPVPGSDGGTWGELLNDYLSVSHNPDGTIKSSALTASGTGATGPSGPIGASGASGAQGATGLQGASGASGAPGVQGPTGASGPAGSVSTNLASYYTNNWSSPTTLGGGHSSIAFNSQNTSVGANIIVSGSNIHLQAAGTYLVSVSGVLQQVTQEGSYANLIYDVGLREETGEIWVGEEQHEHDPMGHFDYTYADKQPYPLLQHFSESSEAGPGIIAQSMSVSQMITVNNAPAVYDIRINNSSNRPVYIVNPSLNIVQLD